MTLTFHERVVRRMVLPLFLLSGVAALIYQTAWQRLLGAATGGCGRFVGADHRRGAGNGPPRPAAAEHGPLSAR
jgi:hypothetical protein